MQMLENLKAKKKVKTCCGKHCIDGKFNRCCGRRCPCVEDHTDVLMEKDTEEARKNWNDMEMIDLRLKVFDRKERLDKLVHLMELAVRNTHIF